jgi:hypothetical protein
LLAKFLAFGLHSKSMLTVGFNAMKLNTISSPTVSSSWAGADGRTC